MFVCGVSSKGSPMNGEQLMPAMHETQKAGIVHIRVSNEAIL